MSSHDEKSLLDQFDAIAPLKQFDAFPKLPATYKSRSQGGGILTVVVIALSFMLILNDIGEFLWGWTDYEFSVDGDQEALLDLNVDIVVNSPCSYLSIDLRDAVGDRLHLSNSFTRDGTAFDVGQAHDLREHGHELSAREILAAARHSRGFFSMFKASRPVYRPTYNHIPDGAACRVYGSVRVKKVTGNFHITPVGYGYQDRMFGHLEQDKLNFSHVISEFSFGPYFPDITQPLDYSFEVANENMMAFQYYISVVPTTYIAPRSRPLHTNQYSVTHYTRDLSHAKGTPGIFFRFDIEPLAVEINQRTSSFTQFIIRIVGVVGGVWVCFGWGVKVATKVTDKVGITTGNEVEGLADVSGRSKKGWTGANLGSLRRRKDENGNGSNWSTPTSTPMTASFSHTGTPHTGGFYPPPVSGHLSPYVPGAGARPVSSTFPSSPFPGSGAGFPSSPAPGTTQFLDSPSFRSPFPPSPLPGQPSGFPSSPGPGSMSFPRSPAPGTSGFPGRDNYAPPPTPGSGVGGGFAVQQQQGPPQTFVGNPPPRRISTLRNSVIEKKED